LRPTSPSNPPAPRRADRELFHPPHDHGLARRADLALGSRSAAPRSPCRRAKGSQVDGSRMACPPTHHTLLGQTKGQKAGRRTRRWKDDGHREARTPPDLNRGHRPSGVPPASPVAAGPFDEPLEVYSKPKTTRTAPSVVLAGGAPRSVGLEGRGSAFPPRTAAMPAYPKKISAPVEGDW